MTPSRASFAARVPVPLWSGLGWMAALGLQACWETVACAYGFYAPDYTRRMGIQGG
jgi:hypothetical protein